VDNVVACSLCTLWLYLSYPRVFTGISTTSTPTPETFQRSGYMIRTPAMRIGIGQRDKPRLQRAMALFRDAMKMTGRPHIALESLYPVFGLFGFAEINEQ
jgi:hypothetical protein